MAGDAKCGTQRLYVIDEKPRASVGQGQCEEKRVARDEVAAISNHARSYPDFASPAAGYRI